MIELADLIPDTNVQPAEYKRLLGYPRDRMLEGRSRELGEWARARAAFPTVFELGRPPERRY